MTEQINKTHIFGECDLDLTKSAKEVWKDLFDICEATGFYPTQEKYGFSVVGPFNIPDRYDLTVYFQCGKETEESKGYIVTDVSAIIKEGETGKVTQKWIIYRAGETVVNEEEVPFI